MDIPFDQYTVCLVPQDGYAYSENLNCGTVDFSSGTLFSVEFGVFSDAKKFRTFSADTLLSKKPVKMVFKSNIRTSLYPNTATALENVFARLGKNGATFLGIAQLDKNRSKNLAWIPYKKAGDLGKLYTSAHNGTAYPIDSLRPAGKPAKKLKGAVKADRKQFNNRVFEQGIAFNLNIIASALGVTPTGFGELVFDSPGSLLGKKLYGMTLAEIAGWMNQLMTNWDSLGVENSSAYAELGEFANVLKKLNDSFSETVDSSNSSIDTSAVTVGDRNITSGKKNAFAVTLHGVRTASEVGLVKYVPGTVPSVKIQDAGFSEDESTLPTETALMQNYPNPFNPSTNFGFLISDFGVVTLKVYDMLGREVATLLNNDEVEQGEYEINFDASSLTSGVYFYRLTVNGVDDASQSFTDVKRMLLVK
ncbi:MAG: T9SS type A sorting domain-containing protein [Ignavibacteriae bacterium]|nr:T9SS type A sorting domain-containing protein [Ignavibacteriota bacterium]